MAGPAMQEASTAIKPSFKRPMFTKPSWAQEDKSSNATDFFRRSNQSYVNIAAEAERKRQKRLARKERERACLVVQQEPPGKRRRTSSDSDSENESDHSSSNDDVQPQRDEKQKASVESEPGVSERKRTQDRGEPRSSPKSLSERYEREIGANKSKISQEPLPCNIINLEDEDEPLEEKEEIVEVTAVKHSNPPPDDDDFPPSDDEFAELARKAREKARTKRLELDFLSSTSDPPSSGRPDDGFSRAKIVHASTPPIPAPDPIVSILITSRIPNTNPLIVNRKISQRLKDVRVTWCQKQCFTPDFTASVFMTWRGKRLFDVTTCRSLGIGVDSNGNIVTKGQKDILGEEERQIHMEAMTEEILEKIEKMKRGEANGEGNGDIGVEKETPAAAEKQETQVRIILKAKGCSDFKLIVKPTTKVSRIVNAFRTEKRVDSDREVFLSFDGDRLAPECQVGETELADMDYVDVYVR